VFSNKIHFLLYGRLAINSGKSRPKLRLVFGKDILNFYASVKKITPTQLENLELDPSLDPTDTKFKSSKSITSFKAYIKKHPNEIIADTLMNQKLFPGVGNIIKNESLYMARINPNRKLRSLSEKDVKKIVSSLRKFSNKFYKAENNDSGYQRMRSTKYLNVYLGGTCPKNGKKIVRKQIGKLQRMTMWCPSHQI
jgi:endonuclease-8